MRVNTCWRFPRKGEVIPDDVIWDMGRVLCAAEDIQKGDYAVIEFSPISCITVPEKKDGDFMTYE